MDKFNQLNIMFATDTCLFVIHSIMLNQIKYSPVNRVFILSLNLQVPGRNSKHFTIYNYKITDTFVYIIARETFL